MRVPMYEENALTLQRGYKCPHCLGHNWRGSIPMAAMKCVYCNKMFTPSTSISAREQLKKDDDIVKAATGGNVVALNKDKDYYGSLHPANQPFRKRIDGLCERFHPEDAYVYADFAVLHFLTPSDAHKLTDIKQISPMLFADLTVYQKLQWVSICKETEGDDNDDDTK